jgi:hypothetical protein
VKIIKHIFRKEIASEVVFFEDEHGRQSILQIPILKEKCPNCGAPYPGGKPDPDAMIEQHIKQHEQDETTVREHVQRRFDPKTLERLK